MVYKSLPMAVGCPTAKAALVHWELPLSLGESRPEEGGGGLLAENFFKQDTLKKEAQESRGLYW